jgi:hypothetical protein
MRQLMKKHLTARVGGNGRQIPPSRLLVGRNGVRNRTARHSQDVSIVKTRELKSRWTSLILIVKPINETQLPPVGSRLSEYSGGGVSLQRLAHIALLVP